MMGTRSSIARVLLMVGVFLIFLILSLLSLIPQLNLPTMILFSCTGILFVLMLFLAIKYRRNQTEEQKQKKISTKNVIWTIIAIIILLAFIYTGVSFFWNLMFKYNFTGEAHENRYLLFQGLIISLTVFFSSTPFIMVLYYRTSPSTAVKFILKLHRLFNRKNKKKVAEIIVLDTPQQRSFYIALKRSFSTIIFSTFTVFTLLINILNIMKFFNIPPLLGLGLVPPDLVIVNDIDSKIFIQYCSGYLLNLSIPVVISFILFFWALPPSYLLDDSGVVFFRNFLKRRRPAEMRTISNWFLSLVKGVVGTSALISYITFIIENAPVIGKISGELGWTKGVQFSLFVLGFPFFGTLLMFFILSLFQESQFNKMKTFLYQELVNEGIDPRIVKVKLTRTGELQEKTLENYYGENYFHHPPLSESMEELDPPGPIPTDKVRD
mgnify:CR=1 FL=1